MANKYGSLKELFTAIANSIRAKTGNTDEIIADNFPEAIESIVSGGSGWDGFYFKTKDEEVEIGKNSFAHNEHLKSVKILNCNGLGDRAFYKCPNLTEARIHTIDGMRNGGVDVFRECNALETVTMYMDTILPYMFCRCENLVNANLGGTFPTGMDTTVDPPEIAEYAFAHCKKLKHIYHINPDDGIIVSEIGEGAFCNCESLEEISIRQCETVGRVAFESCTALKVVDFSFIKSIGESAFYNCSSLTALILRNPTELCVCDFSALDKTPMVTGEGHIYVPASMYEMYRAGYEAALDQIMSGFFNILFRKIEDYPEICG